MYTSHVHAWCSQVNSMIVMVTSVVTLVVIVVMAWSSLGHHITGHPSTSRSVATCTAGTQG